VEAGQLHSQQLLNKALDHAFYSLQGSDSLIPFIICLKQHGEITLERYAAETLEESVFQAKLALRHLPSDVVAYALAYDGYLSNNGIKHNAVLVEVAHKDAPTAVEYGQLYTPSHHGEKPVEIGNVQTLGFPSSAFTAPPPQEAASGSVGRKSDKRLYFAILASLIGITLSIFLSPSEERATVTPYAEIWVSEDYTINRTALKNGENAGTLTWVIQANGVTQLERLAENETQYRHRIRPGNQYTVYLKAFFDGKYHTVSNIIHFSPKF